MKVHGLNPRIRKSPYFSSSLKYGATEFHPYNGMWMPVGYDTPINEYWNTVERAGMWDVAVQAGVVTQAVYSPRLEKNIGFALLDVAHRRGDDLLRVETPEGARNLTITSLPFVDPDKKIPRASLRNA